jgi:sugar O-acyltransferase (sialic acid O-acetyltransferase NeuD family)
MSKPIILIGAGGHAQYLMHILLAKGRNILAYVSPNQQNDIHIMTAIQWLKNDTDVLNYSPEDVELVIGIGQLPNQHLRHQLIDFYQSHHYSFTQVICNTATLQPHVALEQGVQILSNVTINHSTEIKAHSIINTGVIVEHDCIIGSENHIAPGAVICGGVKTAHHVFIGANATIIQNISIGKDTIIGAGCCIVKDLQSGSFIKR